LVAAGGFDSAGSALASHQILDEQMKFLHVICAIWWGVRAVGEILSLIFVGASVALIGWAMIVVASGVERRRKEHHTERYGDRER
jgi:hypothetical protein